ncbi:Site-specific recombinase XerD [Seinonella peptonophila]|uniref:Site-specific recombinase XerD n=1 Tax=Seinonella peptonophila TaxID=112248 RepID=A0A1M4YBY9_9BACL|nr:site-specific integrase [Seinonella peptonophila]SHF03103.1 Site-specific recombinase XerD [Seinonella peptonophila]
MIHQSFGSSIISRSSGVDEQTFPVARSIGKITLEKLKPLDIQRYYTRKLQHGRHDGSGGLSARSVLHHHRLLHKALEFAVKWQLIPKNPAKSVMPPKPRQKNINVLTKSQIHKVLHHMTNQTMYEIVYFAIQTGMRRSEIFGLRWQDVNFTTQTICIRYTLHYHKNIGYRLRETTKTKGSRRTLAISQSVMNLLQQIKQRQMKDKEKLGVAYSDLDLVFARPSGRPLDMNNISYDFSQLVKQLDVPYVHFHSLLHCHASLLYNSGAS